MGLVLVIIAVIAAIVGFMYLLIKGSMMLEKLGSRSSSEKAAKDSRGQLSTSKER